MTDKHAASFHMSNHLKGRGGRRPIRVSTLLKKEKEHLEVPANQEKLSSESGADLRVPLMGGTKFPTKDSSDFARKQLERTQNVAEVRLPKGPKLDEVTPDIKMPVSMPKTGADMTIKNDPLVQYLKKCADVLEDNGEEMPLGTEVKPTTLEDTIPNLGRTEENCKKVISELFDNSESMRKKDTTYDYEEGVVDRILKL